MAKPRGLGKGLDLMIPNVVGEEKGKKVQETKTTEVTKEKEQGETIVKITKVEPNREQPRKYFDEDALQELADSIKQFGLLQPILVQDRKDYYEIIAGERRWRAAKLAGLKEVPVIIRNYTEQEIVEIAEKIKHLNADRIVVTSREDISLVLKEELENGHSVDVAIDCLGGEIMGKCIHYLTHGARWIMIAALAGTKTEIDLKNIYVRNVRIIGSTLRSRTPEMKAEILAGVVRDVYPKIEKGLVKPTIHAVLPIQKAEEAHDILYQGKNAGKVVLTVS